MGWVNIVFKDSEIEKKHVYTEVGVELDSSKYTFIAEVNPEIGLTLSGVKIIDKNEKQYVSDGRFDQPIRKLMWLWKIKESEVENGK